MTLQSVHDPLVTRQELAEKMTVSVATIDRLRRLGMPCVRFSPGTVRFRLNEAMRWAEQRHDRKAA